MRIDFSPLDKFFAYVESIRESRYFQTGEGLNLDELKAVENELDIVFPASYVKFLQKWNGINTTFVIFYSVGNVLEQTLKYREWLSRPRDDDVDVSKHLFFASDGGESQYAFDTQSLTQGDEFQIVDHDLEGGAIIKANSFPEFLEWVVDRHGHFLELKEFYNFIRNRKNTESLKVGGPIGSQKIDMAHVNGNHFVVVEDADDKKVIIADPAGGGKRKLTKAEFSKIWRGNSLVVIGKRDEAVKVVVDLAANV